MSYELKVDGLGKVAEKFANLPFSLRTKLRLAMALSCKAIQQRARENHMFVSHTGMLERSVDTDYSVVSDDLQGHVFLNTQIAYYGPYIHEGIPNDYTIFPVSKKVLRWKSGSVFVFSKFAKHKAKPGEKFLYKAADHETANVREIFANAIAEALKE